MIFLDLSEGLGNQMFQYAFGRYLQEVYDEILYLDTMSYVRNNNSRSFSLSSFKLNENVKYDITVKCKYLDYYSKIRRKSFNATRTNLKDVNTALNLEKKGFYILQNIFEYVPYNYNCKKIIKYVMGSWMNERYFPNMRKKLYHDFQPIVKLKPESQKLIREIASVNSVCVHVRLGDYLSPKWSYLNICTATYYKNGIELIKQYVSNPVFYVFTNTSEDFDYISHNYDFMNEFKYVNLSNSDIEDLEIMKNCKHFIISNSTYSWWAQYLSLYSNKIVIAPKIWSKREGRMAGYNISGKTLGIYQNSWEIVDV